MSSGISLVRLGRYPPEKLPTRKRWPAIPKSVTLAGGKVLIEERDRPRFKSPYSQRRWRVLGYFDPAARLIVLDATMQPAQKWATLLHEVTHAALYDTAAHLDLNAKQEERICEAIGLAWMHQFRFISQLLR